jgi:hypothetical protein
LSRHFRWCAMVRSPSNEDLSVTIYYC